MRKEIFERVKKDVLEYGAAVIGVILYLVASQLIFGRICPSAVVLGVPCPGCGMTRACGLTLRGEFVQAFDMHAFIYPVYVCIFLFLLYRYVLVRDVGKLKKIVFVLAIGSIIYYIYRMYHYFPDKEPLTLWNRSFLGYFLSKWR